MGFLRKTVKRIGRGIKKLGKKIGKAFKKIIKPFAKVFGKLGPLGSIAMMMILPGIGQMLSGFGANLIGGTGVFGNVGTLGKLAGQAIKFTGNAINFIATAPQKIFGSITDALSTGWNALFDRSALPLPKKDWWTNMTSELQATWKGSPVVDKTDVLGLGKDMKVGGDRFFDVSQQGRARIGNFGADIKEFKADIGNLFDPDERIAITAKDAETKFANDPKALQNFIDNKETIFENKKYRLDREGLFGNIADAVGGTTSKIKDITIPGAGDVGDIFNVGSMGLTAYNAYASINPEEIDFGAGLGGGAFAEQQLYSGDQGGLYNTSAPTWSYNPNVSIAQNQQNAANIWNSTYGLPQGFDPFATPGYGYTYQQWLQQSMAA